MENEVKEPAPKYNYVSPEQYLQMERASREKHEYYKGEVFAMSGASLAHNDIAYNINRLVASFLHRKGCKLYGSDFRIYIPENSLFITLISPSFVVGLIRRIFTPIILPILPLLLKYFPNQPKIMSGERNLIFIEA